MAYIRKHYGSWQAIVRKNKIRVIKTFKKKSDASKWAYKTEAQIEVGSYFDVQKTQKLNEIKLHELLDIFFDKTKLKSKHPKRFGYEIEHMKRYPISKLYLSQITPKILAEFRDECIDVDDKSPSTVTKYLGLISRAINLGRRELDIPVQYNPVSLVAKPKERPKVDMTLSDEEWERLVKHSQKTGFVVEGYPNRLRRPLHYMKQMIVFARETLCRQGEIFNLKKQHVDFLKGTAKIVKTKNDNPRTIGLSPLAMKCLKELPTSFDGTFFPIKSRSSFNNYWRLIIRDAELDFTFHSLRHMGASDLITKYGWSIAEVQAQGGWKTLKALQRYLHIQGDHLGQKFKRERG